MHHLEQDRARGTTANAISNEIVRILHEYTGRGPTKARTVIGRDVVTVVLQDTLTRAERNLVTADKADLVLHMRQEFQRAMRKEMVASVEMNMERRVAAFMSANHIDPDMGVEVFVLEPQPESETTEAA